MTSIRARVLQGIAVKLAQRTPFEVPDRAKQPRQYRPKDYTVTAEPWGERYTRVGGTTRPGLLVFVHGGAHVAGSPEGSRNWPIRVARRLGVDAVSLRYRLAPEHPFPAGITDVADSFATIAAAYDGPLLLSGESAGGNAVLGAVQLLHQRGERLPDGLVLGFPWVDLTSSGASTITNAGKDILRTGMGDWAGGLYLAGHDVLDPLASPLFADLSFLPPTAIHVGTRDMILDDSTRLAAKLQDLGVDVTLQVYPGMVHGFCSAGELFPEATQCLDATAAWAAQLLERTSAV